MWIYEPALGVDPASDDFNVDTESNRASVEKVKQADRFMDMVRGRLRGGGGNGPPNETRCTSISALSLDWDC